MNYLAAYIDEETISWVIAETESALVIEHGAIPSYVQNSKDAPNEDIGVTSHAQYPTHSYDTALAFISQSLCSSIEIDLPFSDYKKAEKVIPLQLQDKLPFDIENIHFTVIQDPSPMGELYRYFVNYIDKSVFENILKTFKTMQINFEMIIPESFFLESLIRALIKVPEESRTRIDTSRVFISIGYLNEDTYISESNSAHKTHPEAILSVLKNNQTLHVRKLQLPLQHNFLLPYIESHIRVSLASSGIEPQTINDQVQTILFCTESIRTETAKTFRDSLHSRVEKLDPDYSMLVNKIASPKLLFALYSAQSLLYLKQEETDVSKIVPNLRQGQYKYRAPMTEIKEALLDHIVPYMLVSFFGIFCFVISFLIPLKENKLISDQIQTYASQELQKPIKSGTELIELSNAISELESKLGTLGTISSFSPIDWLYILSTNIPKEVALSLDSISVSTESISFRGTVKDYPTQGKLYTLLEKLKAQSDGKFCEITLDADENIGTQGKKPIAGEIRICK